jgi:hypothetical protein
MTADRPAADPDRGKEPRRDVDEHGRPIMREPDRDDRGAGVDDDASAMERADVVNGEPAATDDDR